MNNSKAAGWTLIFISFILLLALGELELLVILLPLSLLLGYGIVHLADKRNRLTSGFQKR